MTGYQPLIMLAGLLQTVGDRRTEILKLNIGPPDNIVVTGPTFPFNRSVTFARSTTGIQNVTTIPGGEVGDVLFLGGRDVRLIDGVGNLELAANYILQPGRSMILYFAGTRWVELNRSP